MVHDDAQPELTGLFGDLLNAAMREIDWYEIAANMLEEMTRSDD